MINAQLIYKAIRSLIFSPCFKNKHRLKAAFFTRKRELSFGTIVSLILQKMTKSLAIEANHLGLKMNTEPVSKQAISTARHKIGVAAFQELYENALKLHYTDNPMRKWKGFRVFAGDGSTLSLPRRGDLPNFFGDHFERTCLGRIMQYTEVTSDVVVAASLMPYRESEKSMSRMILPDLIGKMKLYGQHDQIYIYDRGFPSHEFAQEHLSLGVHYLFRVQKQFTQEIKECIRKRSEANFIQVIKKNEVNYQARFIIRYLSSGEPLVLMTSLLDYEKYTDQEIIELYQLRWRSEESYKFQKMVLQLDCNNSRTYHGVVQEFWATVLLAALMTFLFNEQEDGSSMRINRRVVFGSLKPKHLDALVDPDGLEPFLAMFEKYCKRHRVPIRPDRSYPRLSVDTRKTRHCYRRIL